MCVQDVCLTHNLSLAADVWFINAVLEDALTVLASTDAAVTSFANLKEAYSVDKAELKKCLAAPDEKSLDDEFRIRELENNKNSLKKLATKVVKVEATLRGSEDHVHFIEDEMSNESNYLLEKDASLRGYSERVVIIEQELAIVCTDIK